MLDEVEVEDLELMLRSNCAICVHNGSKAVWLPISQIKFNHDAKLCDIITVTMPEWLALREGLI